MIDPHTPPAVPTPPVQPLFPDGTTGAAFQPSTKVQAANTGRTVWVVALVVVPVVIAGILVIVAIGGMLAILGFGG